MQITTIKGLYHYLKVNSGFADHTIHGVISYLGYKLNGTEKELQSISSVFINCAKKGAGVGFTGFTDFSDTVKFFKSHQRDIAAHLVNKANLFDLDVLYMIKDFSALKYDYYCLGDIGEALWDKDYISAHDYIYNALSWYVLEEISCTWHNYLEKKNAIKTK